MIGEFYAGVDVGSTTTKAAIVDADGTLLADAIGESGFDFAGAAEEMFVQALESAGIEREQVKRVVSTGYGRRNVAFADEMRTEIFCHAAGAYHYFSETLTIIDIGGQDKHYGKGRICDIHRDRDRLRNICCEHVSANCYAAIFANLRNRLRLLIPLFFWHILQLIFVFFCCEPLLLLLT